MSLLPENLKYAKTHEWSQSEADNLVRIGITDFAQSELGDIMFIGLPEVGRVVELGEQIATIESVKTASDLYSPVAGKIVAINEHLVDEPELVNEDAYTAWLFCIQATDSSQLNQLMSAAEYQQMIDE